MSDLIDRQAAIDAIKTWGLIDGLSEGEAIEILADEEKLPSVQRWIPCSERLPDMHDEVLVTARGEVSIAWLYVDGKWRSNDMPQPMLRDIIAWMPLPEPYKGEQE